MKFRRHRQFADDIDMTPFIDCVFQLIIFFMTCSKFVAQDYEPLKLPEAHKGVDELPKMKSKIVVNVLASGEFLVSGRTCDPTQVRFLLNREMHRSDGPENVIVLVRADRECRFDDIQRLMATCAGVGVWQLSFAVIEEAAP